MAASEVAVNAALKQIYTSNSRLAVSERDVKKIETYYKNERKRFSTAEDLFNGDDVVKQGLSHLPAGRAEIAKQFAADQGLQSSILTECNYAQTLARIFQLRSFENLDVTPVTKLPNQIAYALKQGEIYFTNARYVYYNKSNPDVFLVQYGNPTDGDADLCYHGEALAIEFKKSGGAKAGEYDLQMDAAGKIALSQETWAAYPVLQNVVDKFNAQTTIFAERGRNFKFDDDEQVTTHVLSNYFNLAKTDLLITASRGRLVAIKAKDVTGSLPSGKKIVSTAGSEIRSTGKNLKNIPADLKTRLLDIIAPDVVERDGDRYRLDISDVAKYEIVSGRGNAQSKRLKIESIFAIRNKFTLDGATAAFDIKDVKIAAPTISVHIRLDATKDELTEYYGF